MLLNLIIPIISFGIVSIMGLIMTPFFINNFGYEGLGLISNSNALIQSLFLLEELSLLFTLESILTQLII